MKLSLLLFMIFIAKLSFADYKNYYYNRAKLFSTQKSEVLVQEIPISWFSQKLTHFSDDTNVADRSFQQRYYVNNSHALNTNSPVLFYICGESTCNSSSVNRGAIVEYAKILNANIIALEHRYYGESQPFKLLSTENLRYLSTDEAIEDLAYFQSSITTKLGLNGKWISIGGSYPGSLSAYYRQQHPELVIGALASSAPVKAKAKFNEYDAHVTKVVGTKCAQNIWSAVTDIEMVLDDEEELAKIKNKFNASEIKDPIDFLYFVADISAMAAQYGYIDQFCPSLENAVTPLDGYAKFAKYILRAWGMSANSINISSATSLNPKDYVKGFGMRQWLYQSCTEYGYWQVADENNSTRSSLINLEYHNNICLKLFGILTPVNTNHINEKFFKPLLDKKSASNIMFTNGSTDPWMNLSLLPSKQSNIFNTYLLIQGAAHCDDLRASGPDDSKELTASRAMFINLMKSWQEDSI